MPTLAHFVAYALYRTQFPYVIAWVALFLLKRLKHRFPGARATSGHRLFISAFMIASKVLCDATFSNRSWRIVAQEMFTLGEINQMEREMCGYLGWHLKVQSEEIIDFEACVRAEYRPKSVLDPVSLDASDGPTTLTAHPGTTTTTYLSAKFQIMQSTVKIKTTYGPQQLFASLPLCPERCLGTPSPQMLHFASTNSSLASSPASNICKTPSIIALLDFVPGRSLESDVLGSPNW